MPDVSDRDVVVLAPEKRNRVEPLAASQHVERGHLPLAFGDNPVLDANALAGVGIGPPGDVARGEDPGPAGFEELIHRDAAIERKAGALGNRCRGPHTDTYYQEIGIDGRPATQRDGAPGNRFHRLAQVKHDTVRLVNRLNEPSNFRTHDP